jgi:hypothetical protein
VNDVSTATKALLGGLQRSLIWYRPVIGNSSATRERLAEAMVNTTTVRLKVEQIQLVSGVEQIDLRGIGLQGA